MTPGGEAPLAPAFHHSRSSWFNLRAIRDHSPTAVLAETETERSGLREFLRAYGVEPALDHQADPLVQVQAYLGRPGEGVPSRFCDGSFQAVYLGDAEPTCLAEVAHHLARTLAETDADKGRTHYFILARFRLGGTTLDVRKGFPRLHRREGWGPAQAFGGRAWPQGTQGILFRSVRRAGAANVVVFRAGLVKAGAPMHLVGLRWESGRLVQV